MYVCFRGNALPIFMPVIILSSILLKVTVKFNMTNRIVQVKTTFPFDLIFPFLYMF